MSVVHNYISALAGAFVPAMSTGPSSPEIVQSRFTQGQMFNISQNRESTYSFTFPEIVGSGNHLILSVSNNDAGTGVVSTILDSVNGSWSTTPDQSAVGASARIDVYRFSGTTGGQTKITITFTAAVIGPIFRVFEMSGLAASPFGGGTNAADQTWGGGATPLQAGSFTPTNNDANGGNIILSFFDCSTGLDSSGTVTAFTPSSGFTGLHLDNGWYSGSSAGGLAKSCAYQLQATHAAINPGMTPTGDTADKFNCVAVAYKAFPGTGTARPAGIRILKDTFFFTQEQPGTWSVQNPMAGDLMVALTAPFAGSLGYSSVTDSSSNTWNIVTADTSSPTTMAASQIWWMQPSGANASLEVNFKNSSPPASQTHVRVFDIIGSKSSGVVGANAWNITGTIATDQPNEPSITPTTTGALIFVYFPLGNGPATALLGPSGAFFDNVSYANEADADTYNSGDGWCHFRVTAGMVGSAQNVHWTVVAGTGGVSHGAEFKPA